MNRRTVLMVPALAVIALAAWGVSKLSTLRDELNVRLPEYPSPTKTVWLDQNVSKERLGWFYHADQGTRTFGIPYEWFMALEQPDVSLRVLPTLGVASS